VNRVRRRKGTPIFPAALFAGILVTAASLDVLRAQDASPPDAAAPSAGPAPSTPAAPPVAAPAAPAPAAPSPQLPAASDNGSEKAPDTASPAATPSPAAPTSAAAEKKKADTPSKKEKVEEHEPVDPDTGTSTLSGDTLGLLPNPFESKGVKFTLTYVADALANVDGGMRRGAIYEGRINAAIDLDLAKLIGASGLTFHANAFQSHGPRLSAQYIGNLMPVSSIEELATTRLYEAWFEQKFWNDKLSIRAGQLAADAEFITANYTDAFMTSTYGWPAITSLDLPSGGPSPPLAAMGARVKAILNDNITLLAGVFDGNAAGPGTDNPESRDRYGVNFRVNDPPLAIGEVQYAYNQEKNSHGLPGTVKFGGWYHAGPFDDQQIAANGLSLASPLANGPAQLNSDYGIYAVFQQMLYSFEGPHQSERNIGMFVRTSASPEDQRNLVDFYADTGVTVSGAMKSRPDDKFGIAFAYSHISNTARTLDESYAFYGMPRPVRDYEANITAAYVAQIRKGWTVWPTLQYVIHPGAGYVIDNGVATAVKNAVVVGVRTVVRF
jgi:porin